jgi:hypothetical protein
MHYEAGYINAKIIMFVLRQPRSLATPESIATMQHLPARKSSRLGCAPPKPSRLARTLRQQQPGIAEPLPFKANGPKSRQPLFPFGRRRSPSEQPALCPQIATELQQRSVGCAAKASKQSATLEVSLSHMCILGNDPSAGSPTETLLRLLLPLSDPVWPSSRRARRQATSANRHPTPAPVRSKSLTTSFDR